MLIMAEGETAIKQIFDMLCEQFKLKELGDVAYFLGCRIIRDHDNHTVHMVQDGCINRLKERFHLENALPAHTPFPANTKLEKAEDGYVASKHLVKQYNKAVGSIMWPATITRMETAWYASQLAKYLANPTKHHMEVAEHCLRYLVTHPNEGICLGGGDGSDLQLEGYTDASWADDLDTRRSTCGYLFDFGGPVCWRSGRQPLVAGSTTEAEYIALTLAAREAASLKRLLDEIDIPQKAVVLHEDNQPAIDLLKKPVGEGRTRHIDTRWHYILEEVTNGAIEVHKIHTDQQLADGLTKILNSVKFKEWMRNAGMVDCSGLLERLRTEDES